MEYYETLKPVRSKTTKVIISIAVTLVAIPIVCVAIFAAGAISFFTPDKDRHTTINWAKERVGVQESGKVLLERYDTGDKFLPTSLRVELEGKQPYEKLFEKVQTIPEIKCENASPRPGNSKIAKQCQTGLLRIQVRIEENPTNSITVITFEDVSNGKMIPDPNADGQYKKKR